MDTKLLTTQDVAEALGITRKGVQYLVNTGKLTPDLRAGSRRMNLFDAAKIERIRLAREQSKQ